MNELECTRIEVLVLTYNRASLISATLESLLAQTQAASRICVLDNGSTDNTVKVVRSFATRGVELVCRGSNDPRACWSDLQAMARGPWTMLFHDDDLLHPDYLRNVSAALAYEGKATVVVSSMRVHHDPESANWGKIRSDHFTAISGRNLAARLYGGFHMPFCSVIYRTELLKKCKFEFETYGKIWDRPFVVNAAIAGRAVLMLDPYVKYRVHASQDSTNQASGPFLAEVLALQRYYRKVLGESLLDSGGRIFLRRNYRNLLGEYTRLNLNSNTPILRREFFRKALTAEAASEWSLKFGWIYASLTQTPRKLERQIKRLIRRNDASTGS